MARYILGYHGDVGMETSEEDMAVVMAAWEAWFTSMGDAILDGGAPTGQAKTVGAGGAVADGGGSNPLTGYSIVSADSIDAAAEMAKGCPSLTSGGSVEVAELIEM